MQRLAITDAQDRLDELVERVADGEDIVLMRNGMPIARITQYSSEGRFGRPEKSEDAPQFSEDYIG